MISILAIILSAIALAISIYVYVAVGKILPHLTTALMFIQEFAVTYRAGVDDLDSEIMSEMDEEEKGKFYE